ETDRRRWMSRERVVARDVAREPVGEAARRNAPEHILRRTKCVGPAPTSATVKHDRKGRREPTDRARDVDVVEGRFTSVRLEVEERCGAAGPFGDAARERGEQGVVDLRAERAGYVGKQRESRLGIERFGHDRAIAREIVTRTAIAWNGSHVGPR